MIIVVISTMISVVEPAHQLLTIIPTIAMSEEDYVNMTTMREMAENEHPGPEWLAAVGMSDAAYSDWCVIRHTPMSSTDPTLCDLLPSSE